MNKYDEGFMAISPPHPLLLRERQRASVAGK